MSRENGPIWVFSREDTIPTDSEGGYAGGDSTAYAVGMSLDQSGKALGTVDNLAVTARTLDYGQEATATITGASPWKTIEVGIPKGMPDTVGAQLTADAAASADAAALARDDADAAVLLAQQAQAAAYNVPDVAMRDIINNPATETHGALTAREPTKVIPRGQITSGADATATIQAALDALDAAAGGTVTLPTLTFAIRIDGTIRLDPRKTLVIPSGCELRRVAAHSTSTEPVVLISGNHAGLKGGGRVTSENASPYGVVRWGGSVPTKGDVGGASMTAGSTVLTVSGTGDTFAAEDVGKSVSVFGAGASGRWTTGTIVSVESATSATLSAAAVTTTTTGDAYWGVQRTVCWARADVRVSGDQGPTSVGHYLDSSPQGQTGLTVGCQIAGQVEDVHTGVAFRLQANGNSVLDLQWYRITGDGVLLEDVVEDGIVGGFVHNSTSLQSIIRGEKAVYCAARGVQGEPGGGQAYNLDARSHGNSLDISANVVGASLDAGPDNHVQLRTHVRGQRIEARDGLTIPVRTGGYADADFVRAATTGLVAGDSTANNSRLQVRIGSSWKSTRLATRLLGGATIKDAPSIPAGDTWETTYTLAGAQPGDVAVAAPSVMPPAGVVWSAAVSAVDTVTLRLANVSSSAVDPASTAWRIEVHSAT